MVRMPQPALELMRMPFQDVTKDPGIYAAVSDPDQGEDHRASHTVEWHTREALQHSRVYKWMRVALWQLEMRAAENMR